MKSKSKKATVLQKLPSIPKGKRSKSHSEHHMLNFNLPDTMAYLDKINRPDVDAELLYLELNKSILEMDLLAGEIAYAQFASKQFNDAFQKDLVEVIKSTRSLCKVLGVQKDGKVRSIYNIQKAKYSHTTGEDRKQSKSDNFYHAFSHAGLVNSKELKSVLNAEVSYADISLTHPAFVERIKAIAEEINLLKVLAECIRKQTSGGQLLLNSNYYRDGVSFGLSPEQWMVARKLPEIYTDFFGQAPQIVRSRMGGPPSGKGLDFIVWCLERMNISLSVETISKYYYKYRMGQAD